MHSALRPTGAALLRIARRMFVPLALVFAVPAPALGQVPLEDLATGDTIRFRLEEWTFDLRRLLHGRFEEPTPAGIVYTALPSEERGVLPYDAIERLDVRVWASSSWESRAGS